MEPAREQGDRLSDLHLASQAAAGDSAAVRALAQLIEEEARAAARSLRMPDAVADEARQRLMERLLVGDAERPPAIREYEGRGAIRGFLRVSAVRECLHIDKAARREAPGLEIDELQEGSDPELERLKVTYREHFRVCFEEALKTLTPRERRLLRYHSIERLGIDRIGEVYGVHRATAARWLQNARQRIAEITEARIAERLQLDPSEVASMIRLVRSQIDLTLERVLT